MTIRIEHGDSREVLKTLGPNSVDSVCTDPPYALVSITKRFGKLGSAEAKEAKEGKDGLYRRVSAGFMGQQWDTGETVFDPAFWAEVLRVMKPGAHLVAFSGTRTYHRMACAIEDAGFEIRDMIGWLYGSGFPKSHDVSKGIDKRRDWSALPRLQGAIRVARKTLGISQSEAARRMGLIAPGESLGGGGFMWFETGMRMPTAEQWPMLKAALSISDEFDLCFEEAEREITGTVKKWENRINFAMTTKDGFRRQNPAPDDAKRWEGWGTALKPAQEPIVLARKPLIGTVAENVLKYGTGALNIDGCRVEAVDNSTKEWRGAGDRSREQYRTGTSGRPIPTDVGRWPANIIHDGSEEVISAFPDSDGQVAALTGREPSSKTNRVYGQFDGRRATSPRGDNGSAARFFYSAKADSEDRLGSKHPTVKPIDLMAYLCRLITPPGGTILDPFAGSGTTAIAAMREGFDCILIEREERFVADIHARLEALDSDGRHSQSIKNRHEDQAKAAGADTPLFANLNPAQGE